MSTARKLVSLGIRLVRKTKQEALKELKRLEKAGALKKGDTRTLARLSLREAMTEQARIRKFATAELKRELKKAATLKNILSDRGQRFLKAHGIEVKIKKR